MSARRSSCASVPAPVPTITIRPLTASASSRTRFGAPTSSRHDVRAPLPGDSARPASPGAINRPRRAKRPVREARPLVRLRARVRLPLLRSGSRRSRRRRCHRSRGGARPSRRSACERIASCAVMKASGTAAAPRSSRIGGYGGRRAARERATRSASPPPPTIPNTRRPVVNRRAVGPHAATVPATSIPGMSAETPGGAGYRPARCARSAGLSAAYRTRPRRSSSPVGCGSGPFLERTTTSFPPAAVKTTRLHDKRRRAPSDQEQTL